jgi:hypothetical protein
MSCCGPSGCSMGGNCPPGMMQNRVANNRTANTQGNANIPLELAAFIQQLQQGGTPTI